MVVMLAPEHSKRVSWWRRSVEHILASGGHIAPGAIPPQIQHQGFAPESPDVRSGAEFDSSLIGPVLVVAPVFERARGQVTFKCPAAATALQALAPRLRQEINCLKEDNQSSSEMSQTEAIPNGNQRRFSHQIPPEILLEIFQFAVPPDILFEHSLILLGESSRRQWSAAVTTKYGIVLVCQTWYSAGIALLYKHPVLYHHIQAVSFRNTIKSNPRLGNLVKHIEFAIRPFVISEDAFQELAGTILQRDICSRLHRISFSMPFDDASGPRQFFTPLSTLRSIAPIAHLDLTIPLDVDAIHALLEGSHAQLEYLTISLHAFANQLEPEPIALEFSHLKFLRIVWPSGPPPDAIGLVEGLTSKWSMSNLSQLVLRGKSYSYVEPFTDFCLKHRTGLHFICFELFPSREDVKKNIVMTAFESIIQSCPSLEHIVIPEINIAMLSDFQHPTLAYLDFWVGGFDAVLKTDVHRLRDKFPNLISIRTMSIGRPNPAEMTLATRDPLAASRSVDHEYPERCEFYEGGGAILWNYEGREAGLKQGPSDERTLAEKCE
ncbi:hypothetical protein HGRIS_002896 [Hohenbuehelia grisea]|uniref:F-box domain-containing protein n=1 Tax=Hohenbuehelia grisea TaxID=104357 RepID=A0ABR3JM13_9AGAR